MNKSKQEEEITPEKKWKSATIANNFIFYKIMRHNPDVCTELLEILLEMEIDHIEMHGEETIETDFESKGIRLDVYAKNDSKAFNLEMQPRIVKSFLNVPDIIRAVLMSILFNPVKSIRNLKIPM